MPRFELFVAARYLRAKRKQAVISVITVISILGVTAGVMALVVALASNNGFRSTLRGNLAGATAQLTVTTSAKPDRDVVAGSSIRYTIAATNTGTVALHDVSVTDPMPGLSKLSCSPRPPATVAVGATVRCTATAVVTPADVAAPTGGPGTAA